MNTQKISKQEMKKAEKEKKEADKKAEKEKKEADKKAEKEKKEADKKTEKEKKEADKKAEKEKKENEKKAEKEKKENEKKAEKEKKENEKKAEKEKKENEKKAVKEKKEVVKEKKDVVKEKKENEKKVEKEKKEVVKENKENDKCINEIKIMGNKWVDKLLEGKITYTKPGSILHLLYGEKPSEQSISIKFGRCGEFISKELIKMNKNLELLDCGIQIINDKRKDVDLIFKNNKTNTIHYYELKGNIEVDTEKLPATIAKCQEIEYYLKNKYPNYIIDCGILNWSVYNRSILNSGLSNIKTFEKNIKIIHMEEFLKMINIIWNEEDYYSYFKSLGNKIRN
jgi:hypothetical protein